MKKVTKNEIHIDYFTIESYEFILGSFDGKLCMVDFRCRKNRSTIDARIQKALDAVFVVKDDAILQETRQQLQEYFAMQRKVFDLDILFVGSVFQKSVWKSLLEIPYAQCISYLELSKDIGKAEAVRAVANAVAGNALGIVVPCHRVIGSDGSLTGYAGGLDLKRKLLALENN